MGSVLIFTLILSVAKGKAPNYYLSAVAPISVITGKWIYNIRDIPLKRRKQLFQIQNILILIIAVLFIVVVYFFSHSKWWIPVVLILLAVIAFLLKEKFRLKGIEKMLFATLIVSATLNLFASYFIIPDLFSYQGARQALNIYERYRGNGDILKNLQLEEFELFYWANSPVQSFTNWDDMYVFLNKKGAWIYTNKKGYDVILQIRNNVEKVYEIPQHGMNHLSITFLNPETRKSSLVNNYLIKINGADKK